MDGEVAQIAALVISANHRIANPGDPMPWFSQQRAFASCREISFCAGTTGGIMRKKKPQVLAETPVDWLAKLEHLGVTRVILGFERLDLGPDPDDRFPDRVAAGFAGGGSAWRMCTQTPDGGALGWVPRWRAAFPKDPEKRIWAARYYASPAPCPLLGASVADAAEDLREACVVNRSFAHDHQFDRVADMFSSSIALLDGTPDPLPVPRPPGPADVLAEDARRLLFAAQRAWTFDNMSLWQDGDFSQDIWRTYAGLSETLYDAVTAAMVAAVNSTVPGRD